LCVNAGPNSRRLEGSYHPETGMAPQQPKGSSVDGALKPI
jgi:hypothetical protein